MMNAGSHFDIYRKSKSDIFLAITLFISSLLYVIVFVSWNTLDNVAQDIHRYFHNYYDVTGINFHKDPVFGILTRTLISINSIHLLVNYQLIFIVLILVVNKDRNKDILNALLILAYIYTSRMCLDYNFNTIRSSFASVFLVAAMFGHGGKRFLYLILSLLTHLYFASIVVGVYLIFSMLGTLRTGRAVVGWLSNHYVLCISTAFILGRFIEIDGAAFEHLISVDQQQAYRYFILERVDANLSVSLSIQVLLLALIGLLSKRKSKDEKVLSLMLMCFIMLINIHPIVQRFIYPIILYFLIDLEFHKKYLVIMLGFVSTTLGTLFL